MNKKQIIKIITPMNEAQMREEFSHDIIKGLCQSKRKYLSSKYLYDDEGSRLFAEIMELPEYYLSRKELTILQKQSLNITKCVFSKMDTLNLNIIELGCGTGEKIKDLIRDFQKQKVKLDFFALDISSKALSYCSEIFTSEGILDSDYCHFIQANYIHGLEWIVENHSKQNLLIFLGSSIGNFLYEDAVSFLKSIYACLNKRDLLFIGFDLKKDIALLQAAYNDSKGITATFNLNLLKRINSEFDANFDVSKFVHHSYYDPVCGSMQSFIISSCVQTIHIRDLGVDVSFEEFEPLHLEYSKKFTEKEVTSLAKESNFQIVSHFRDENNGFLSSLWRVQ